MRTDTVCDRTENVTKKGLRLRAPITATDDEHEKYHQAELRHEACREEPLPDPTKEEYDTELTTAGMHQELQARKGCGGVCGGVHTIVRKYRYLVEALPTLCYKCAKGSEVRCSLVCKGRYQDTTDKGDIYASTPLLIGLKLLLHTNVAAQLLQLQR